jgi:hypothetical protein
VYDEGRRIVEEVESMGGMAAAVASGWPKLKIEECAAKRQANIDSGKEVIVGVNKYKLDTEDKIDVLVIDNQEVKAKQLARLEQVGTCSLTSEIELCASSTPDSSTACFFSRSCFLLLQRILVELLELFYDHCHVIGVYKDLAGLGVGLEYLNVIFFAAKPKHYTFCSLYTVWCFCAGGSYARAISGLAVDFPQNIVPITPPEKCTRGPR